MSHEASQCSPDAVGKETICDTGDTGSIPGSGTRQPTPVFVPEGPTLQSRGSRRVGHD